MKLSEILGDMCGLAALLACAYTLLTLGGV